jgi:cytidylate kinase
MLITISGLSGSGKSTAAKGLGKRLGLPTVDIGTIFRRLASHYGMDVIEFGRYAERHPKIDRELDEAMVARAKRGNLILQGRLAGWMTLRHGVPAYRIWLSALPSTRARRVAGREGIPYAKALADIRRRDRDNRTRYLKTYGLDLNDLTVYDSVVRTDNLTVEEVVSSLARILWPMRRKTLKNRRKSLPRATSRGRRKPLRSPKPRRKKPRPRR